MRFYIICPSWLGPNAPECEASSFVIVNPQSLRKYPHAVRELLTTSAAVALERLMDWYPPTPDEAVGGIPTVRAYGNSGGHALEFLRLFRGTPDIPPPHRRVP